MKSRAAGCIILHLVNDSGNETEPPPSGFTWDMRARQVHIGRENSSFDICVSDTDGDRRLCLPPGPSPTKSLRKLPTDYGKRCIEKKEIGGLVGAWRGGNNNQDSVFAQRTRRDI